MLKRRKRLHNVCEIWPWVSSFFATFCTKEGKKALPPPPSGAEFGGKTRHFPNDAYVSGVHGPTL